MFYLSDGNGCCAEIPVGCDPNGFSMHTSTNGKYHDPIRCIFCNVSENHFEKPRQYYVTAASLLAYLGTLKLRWVVVAAMIGFAKHDHRRLLR